LSLEKTLLYGPSYVSRTSGFVADQP
jgi:hypothetical protein